MNQLRTFGITALTGLAAACAAAEPAAVDVALADAGAGNPTIAVTADGAALAAWIETSHSGSNVYVARIDEHGQRGAAVRVNDVAGDAAPHDQAPPQVVADADGAVYVLWQNNTVIPGRRFPASDLRFARSLDGGETFEPAIFVNDDAGGMPASHTFQDIAVAADGTIYVSWIDGRERARAERQSHESAGAMHDAHAMSMPGSDVRIASSTDGGRTFSPGVVVHPDVCPCCRTSLAVGSDGMVAVAFRSATQNIRDIMVVRSSDGGHTFAEPVRVHEDGWVIDGCPHAGASLAFDSAGRTHIAWYTGAAERQGLWYAVANDDGPFAEPVPIQTGGWVPVSQVKLTAAADGTVWLAWDDRRREQPEVSVARVSDGGMRTLGTTVPGHSPAIAGGARTVAVAWQNDSTAAARLLLLD